LATGNFKLQLKGPDVTSPPTFQALQFFLCSFQIAPFQLPLDRILKPSRSVREDPLEGLLGYREAPKLPILRGSLDPGLESFEAARFHQLPRSCGPVFLRMQVVQALLG
jgi:hypothetical protein